MNILYNCVNDLKIMLPIMKQLDSLGLKPVYISGFELYTKGIEEHFPEALLHEQHQAIFGNWPEHIADKAFTKINQKILIEYADVQKTYMEMAITRCGGRDTFEFYEIADCYHRTLAASLELIATLKPSIWLSMAPPHCMFDYVMYEVCRRNNIKTLMFVHTHLPSRMLLADNLNYVPNKLYAAVGNALPKKLDDQLNEYINGVRSDYEKGIPLIIKKNHDADNFQKYSEKNILLRLAKKTRYYRKMHLIASLKAKLGINDVGRVDHYLKQGATPWAESYKTTREYSKKCLDDLTKTKQLVSNYHQHAKKIDLNRKFVYFPMNMQPECTTVPQAGVYSDQLLTLRMLSKALPDDWCIYAKECPAIYDTHRASFARHRTYYDEIAQIDNVKLVPLTADPFLLIDKSQCVACSTGTAGWEAMLRGIPAMMLGNLYWFKGFPSLTDIKSFEQMESFFQKLTIGSITVDQEETDTYINALYHSTVKCGIDHRLLKHFGISLQENSENMVQAVIGELN